MKKYYFSYGITFLLIFSVAANPLKQIGSEFTNGHLVTKAFMMLGGVYCIRQLVIWHEIWSYSRQGYTSMKQTAVGEGKEDFVISQNSFKTSNKTDVAVLASVVVPLALFELYKKYFMKY